jgi:fatty-acyl-CoA synthase
MSSDQQLDLKVKQGRVMWGVEMKIVDDNGRELPHDGKAFGMVKVRGPWIAKSYFKGEGGTIVDEDGFFRTGDVATIDPEGFMQITDRAKDVIKSGGEWISSIDLENAALAHPAVQEAAVIGIAHPTWQERPLLLAQLKPGTTATRDELMAVLTQKVAKWWLPDDILFVSELPHTATGKLNKLKLRELYRDHKLPT